MPITTNANQVLDYHVDLVMCIDATGSMYKIIDEVKANALSFHNKFVAAMEAENKSVQKLRIKVIAFRDYGADSEPMVESRFFELGEGGEDGDFSAFVNKIEASGGGDTPENALEAIALAMKSDWDRGGAVRRHVILVYSDAPALKLGERAGQPNYPTDLPKDLAELHEMWEGQLMEKRARRLQLFTPDCEPWSEMIGWKSTNHYVSQAGMGCGDQDLDECIHLLVKSI